MIKTYICKPIFCLCNQLLMLVNILAFSGVFCGSMLVDGNGNGNGNGSL